MFKRAHAMAQGLPPEAAVEKLGEHLTLDPENAGISAAYGVALAAVGRLDEALEALEQAHYLQPNSAEMLFQYARALLVSGKERQGRLRMEAVLRLDPEHAGALQLLSPEGRPAVAPEREPGESSQPRPRPAPAAAPSAAPRTPPPPRPPSSPRTDADGRSGPGGPGQARGPEPGQWRSQPPGPERRALTRRPPPGEGPGSPGAPARYKHRAMPVDLPPQPLRPGWDPDRMPGFLRLFQATIFVWFQQLGIWWALLAIPNLVVAVSVPVRTSGLWWVIPAWCGALGVVLGPCIAAVADQWVYGSIFQERETVGTRIRRAFPLGLLYPLLGVAPFGVLAVLQSGLQAEVLFLGALILTAPFHVLLAPALVLAATEGPGGIPAVRRALALAGSRTWTHLALFLLTFAVIGSLLVLLGWAFTVSLKIRGDGVYRVLQVAGVSLVESLWVVLLTVCGTDSLTLQAPTDFTIIEADEEEEEEEEEEAAPPVDVGQPVWGEARRTPEPPPAAPAGPKIVIEQLEPDAPEIIVEQMDPDVPMGSADADRG